MKLTPSAISALTVRLRNRLALELNCSVVTVDRWIKSNDPNSDLTKKRAVEIISEETGLQDSEILQESEAINAVK